MRLTSIKVENFRRLRQLQVEFGPEINVLSAPNDFGKSTLVDAIRAALLLPSTSNEGQSFVPWGTDAIPKVILCFSLNGFDWRVSKSFASNKGQAILEKSDKGHWLEIAKGRDVDGRLRKLLLWGVPEPGGKDAPKGWPKSYLATALLGRQDDVAGLLETSLANDKMDSGRQLIAKALVSSSQDPLVTKLIEALDEEIRGEFTATGQLSRGANTQLALLTREIVKLENEIEEWEKQVLQSEGVEARIPGLTEEWTKLQQKVDREQLWVTALSAVREAEIKLANEEAFAQKESELRELFEKAEAAFVLAESTRDETETAWQLHLNNVQNARERLTIAETNFAKAIQVTKVECNHRLDALKTTIDRADHNSQLASKAITARAQADGAIHQQNELQERVKAAGLALATNRKLAILVNLLEERDIAQALVNKRTNSKAEADSANFQLGVAQTAATNAAKETQLAFSRLNDIRASLAEITRKSQDLAREIDSTKKLIEQHEEPIRNVTQHEPGILEAEACFKRIEEEKLAIEKIRQQVADGQQRLLKLNALRAEITARRQTGFSWVQSGRIVAIVWILSTIVSGLLALGFGASVLILGLCSVLTGLTIAGIVGGVHYWHLTHRHLLNCDRELADLVLSVDQFNMDQHQLVSRLGVAELRLENSTSEYRRLSAGLGKLQSVSDEYQARIVDEKTGLQRHQQALSKMIEESLRAPTITDKHLNDAIQSHEKHERMEEEQRRRLDLCRTVFANANAAAELAAIAAAGINLEAIDSKIAAAQADCGITDGLPGIDRVGANNLVLESEALLREAETDLKLAEQRRHQAEKYAEAAESNLLETPKQVLAAAEIARNNARKELTELSTRISPVVADADLERQSANKEIEVLAALTPGIQSAKLTAASRYEDAVRMRNSCQINLQANKQSVPVIGPLAARAALDETLSKLPNDAPRSTTELLSLQHILADSRSQLKRSSEALERIRGQLALVRGNVARERLAELRSRLARKRRIASDRELDLNAHYLALTKLQAAEAENAAHLGRIMAEPVTKAFVELTNQRYGNLTLDTGLTVSKVNVDRGPRDGSMLSVGTRDQLATLVRLAVARAIGSALILDDQLTHSDEGKLNWFCTHLRRWVADNGPQIIVFTCRPTDYQALQSDLPEEFEINFAKHCRFTNLLTAVAD